MSGPGPRYAGLQRALPDERSGRVVFLSHCLLNQNTRYLGGAVCPGAVTSAVAPYLDAGTGIVQLPCPEQRVWGGVLKTRLLWLLEHRGFARAGSALARVITPYLRHRYAKLARAAADDIEDYLTAGFTVQEVVGVAGSPSCGAGTTLDLGTALTGIARCPLAAMTTSWMNDTVIAPAIRPGNGLFTAALIRELDRRQLSVPVTEYPLAARAHD